MGRKTSRGVIKYAVFKEFNKIMKGGFILCYKGFGKILYRGKAF